MKLVSAHKAWRTNSLFITFMIVILFDNDGTLIESEYTLATYARDELIKFIGQHRSINAEKLSQDIESFMGRHFGELKSYLSLKYKITFPSELLSQLQAAAHRLRQEEVIACEGILPMLASLNNKQIIKAIVTNPPSEYSKECWRRTGIISHFEERHIFSAESLGLPTKPSPDICEYAIQQIGIDKSHAVAIEDSIPGIEAYVAAGIAVVGYLGGKHHEKNRYPNSPMVQEMRKKGAFEVIMHHNQLLPLIQNRFPQAFAPSKTGYGLNR